MDGELSAVTSQLPAASSWWCGWKALWLNALLLGVLLLVFVPIINNGSTGFPDEGVYAAQFGALSHGSWAHRRPVPELDPEGIRTAVRAGTVRPRTYLAYPRHPLFSILELPFFEFGGVGGVLFFSAAAVLAAALAAAFLARRIDTRLGVPALWLAGAGCPLLFDAYLISGHALAAALFGIGLLGLLQALGDRRHSALLFALPALALLVNVRSEGVIAAGVTGGLIGLLALVPLRRGRLDWRVGWIGASVLAVSGLSYLLDTKLSGLIIGTGDFGYRPMARLLGETDTDPLHAAWLSLARPLSGDGVKVSTALVLALCASALGALVLRLLPSQQLTAVALFVMAALASVAHLFGSVDLVSGLMAAFPLLIPGLLLLRWGDLQSIDSGLLLATSVGTAGLLVFLIYDIGGGLEWGGRFFHVLLPALVPLVVMGFDRGLRSMTGNLKRVVLGALVVTSVAISVSGVRVNYEARRFTRAVVSEATAFALQHPSTERPLVVMALQKADGTSRMFWSQLDQLDVMTANGAGDLLDIADRARMHGYRSFTVVSNLQRGFLDVVVGNSLDGNGWTIGPERAAGRSGMYLYQLSLRRVAQSQ